MNDQNTVVRVNNVVTTKRLDDLGKIILDVLDRLFDLHGSSIYESLLYKARG